MNGRNSISTIAASQVGKRYRNGVWGVRDVTFSIEAGTLCALVGPNGAGKSTLLNLLGGVIKASEGSVRIASVDGLVGWCPQRNLIDWSLTVSENILLAAQLAGFRGRSLSGRLREVLELLQLTEVAGRPAEDISGGQLRRTQIARAIVGNPAVMILDEPGSGLDPQGTELLFTYLRNVVLNGGVLLVSSHDLHALQAHADRVMLLDSGKMVFDGTVSRFISETRAPVSVTMITASPIQNSLREYLSAFDLQEEGQALRVKLPSGTSVAEVLRVVVGSSDLIEFSVDVPDLHSAYLRRYAREGGP